MNHVNPKEGVCQVLLWSVAGRRRTPWTMLRRNRDAVLDLDRVTVGGHSGKKLRIATFRCLELVFCRSAFHEIHVEAYGTGDLPPVVAGGLWLGPSLRRTSYGLSLALLSYNAKKPFPPDKENALSDFEGNKKGTNVFAPECRPLQGGRGGSYSPQVGILFFARETLRC